MKTADAQSNNVRDLRPCCSFQVFELGDQGFAFGAVVPRSLCGAELFDQLCKSDLPVRLPADTNLVVAWTGLAGVTSTLSLRPSLVSCADLGLDPVSAWHAWAPRRGEVAGTGELWAYISIRESEGKLRSIAGTLTLRSRRHPATLPSDLSSWEENSCPRRFGLH
jgi:hypothetical protein